MEYLAGTEHYNNFKNFVKNGGLKFLVNEAGLNTIHEVENSPQTAHLMVIE